MQRLESLIGAIAPPRRGDPERVRAHLGQLTKPPGSLGRLEELALRLAIVYGDPPRKLQHRVIILCAGDHGVTQHGVSAYPSSVTEQMCRNFASGGAAVNAIARAVGAEVLPVDVGVDGDLGGLAGIEHRKVRRGTRDLSAGPALTMDEVVQAIVLGADLVAQRARTTDVIGLGEMGIGNSTSAAAVTAALTGRRATEVTGTGTGVDGEALESKRRVVGAAVERLPPRPAAIDVLAEVGGLEIAALAGVVLGAARAERAVVTDGFIATAGALCAVRLCPAAQGYIFPSHCSPEPGHRVLLEALDLEPLFDLAMRLGEGTGAALAFPFLEAAAAVLREMATFADAGISGPTAPVRA